MQGMSALASPPFTPQNLRNKYKCVANQIIVGLRFSILRFFYSQIFILRFFYSRISILSFFASQIFAITPN